MSLSLFICNTVVCEAAYAHRNHRSTKYWFVVLVLLGLCRALWLLATGFCFPIISCFVLFGVLLLFLVRSLWCDHVAVEERERELVAL